MQLNLPILEQVADSKNILIAGAGGGFDIFIGLPIYFTLRQMGKTVHLANYSFMDTQMACAVSQPHILRENLLLGAQGRVNFPVPYYPEGFLAQWFKDVRGEDVTVWMFGHTGAAPLAQGYATLTKHLDIDALILVDGGVDSIMRGDEELPGTLIEDSLSLCAVEPLDIPVKILACLGFGTEVEEMVCHHHALENIAALAKEGAFLGSCALTQHMEAFQLFESAARYVWEQPNHHKSHISTRVIPSVHGHFGEHHMYDDDKNVAVFISPLMSLYWFFDANAVIRRSLIMDALRPTMTTRDAFRVYESMRYGWKIRPRKSIPY